MITRGNPRLGTISRDVFWAPFAGFPGWLLRLELWMARHRQRRSLLELSDHMLKDIGVSRSEALLEGGKPFWRP